MTESSIAPRRHTADPTCPYCWMMVAAHAKKCGHCGEWLVERNPMVAIALVGAGWAWVTLSILGAIGFLMMADTAMMVRIAYATAVLLQGLVFGLSAVLFGQSQRPHH